MKVAYVVPFHNSRSPDPAGMLDAYPILRALPAELAALGHEVHAFLHAPSNAAFMRSGVAYRCYRPDPLTGAIGRALQRWKPRYGPAYYQPSWRMLRDLRRLRPDVVHLSGLTLDIQLALVARLCERGGARLVVHYHGGEPGHGRLARLQRHNLRRVDRVLFTTTQQARPWVAAGLLPGAERATVVLETSSPFTGLPRDIARRRTGMTGSPVYLSVGRLDPIKDPLTTLRAFGRIIDAQPEARLYLYYLTGELLPEARTAVAADARLAGRVDFRGAAPLAEMEAIYSSADILLQASQREWSGLAVLEAMSCGCVPVVSDIPSFRAMTADGCFGRLFPVGDDDGMARAAMSLDTAERARLSSAVRAHFERELSFAALARRVDTIYRELNGANGG